jgi:pimeloyl-ACP methyl ester carboxylesterase
MRRALALARVLIAFWVTAGGAAAQSYDYPFSDPYVATVVGTPKEYQAELPKQIPIEQHSISIFKDREPPEVFWYDDQLHYSYAVQDGPAPLVFLIAGTGGSYAGEKNRMMARAFYQAGFHVVSLSSPTFMNFIVAASETGVPGHAYQDAEDLYRVMERIWARLKKDVQVTDFYVTGYSLGGFNTAFVTWLDERRKVFRFKKALLINPPVRLYSSISLLDRMTQNIPGGVDNFNRFFERLMKGFSEIYKRSDQLEMGPDTLYRAYKALHLKDEQVAALIGVSFRLSSATLAFTSDVINDFGYIKPKNVHLTKNTSLDVYSRVAHRLGFTDYFHYVFYPYFKAKDPSLTRSGLIEEMSLADMEDYLRGAQKIEVMHNQDDIILQPGEIDFFRRVFGERATIYPKGGHCGNMAYRDNVAHMVGVFKQ